MSEGNCLHHLCHIAGALQGRGKYFTFGCCDEFPAVLGIQMCSGFFLLAKALQWKMLRQYLFIPAVPDLYCLCGSCSVIPWKATQTSQEGDCGELEGGSPFNCRVPLSFL